MKNPYSVSRYRIIRITMFLLTYRGLLCKLIVVYLYYKYNVMESKKQKFRQTLDDLVDCGRFIPGIYNYCDRWCERCTLSHKCLTWAHEQEMKENCNDPVTNDIDNEKFWEQIRLSFEVTLDMISEDASKMGINLDELPIEEEQEHVDTPVEKLANEYGLILCKWLDNNSEKLRNKANQLLMIHNNQDITRKFAEALEVVQWYCFYISAKVHRSHFDLDNRIQEENPEEDSLFDNRGSAKIAIIALNRSMEALAVLYPELKDFEDDILNFLSMLSRIKRSLLTTFPTAMDFKRPGFDD